MRRIGFVLFAAAVLPAAVAPAAEKAEEGSLRQVMQQLGRDYAAMNRAILLEDFDGAAESARAIAYHDTPSMGQRLKIMAALKAEMPNFKEADERLHRLAVAVEEAARAGDMERMIRHQSQMLAACMSCHRPYRSRVVNLGRQSGG